MFGLFKRKAPQRSTVRVEPWGWEFMVEPGQTLLQAALAQDLPWPSRCRVGSCTTCRCRLLDGEVTASTDTAYVLSREQLDQGYVLACQSRPVGHVRVQLDRVRTTLPPDVNGAAPAAR